MEDIKSRLQALSDNEVLDLLDQVSAEVKRRNSLQLPEIPKPGTPEFEGTMGSLLEALGNLAGPVKGPNR